MFACTDAPCIEHIAHKDTTIADLTRMGYFKNDFYSWIEKHVAAHDGDGDTLDHVGTVLYTTIDSLLTALADAVNVVVLKPVDVGRKQSSFHLLELSLTDNRFNLFHTS